VLLALAILMPFAGQAQSLPFMEDPDAIDRVVKSILMLEVYDKNDELVATGSGFVAFDNDTLVTNYHVMDDASKIVANSDTGNRYMVTKVIAADPDKDIAILEFSSPADLEPLTLDTETKPRRIDPVVAIGSPKGIAISASKGNISAVYEESSVEYIQFTAPISPGSSGGAL
jgi:S1-C subfamily serine protease